MKPFIGVDLGGTNLRAGVVDLDSGQVLEMNSVPTMAREGYTAVMDRMAELIQQTITARGLEAGQVGGVGIGVPGALDLKQGLVVFLPNLPGNWPHVPLQKTIAEKTGLPVFLLNDARAITYGEWRFGAGQGVDTMACFTMGTGIGGGLVINGQLYLGLGGTSGELGHITVDPDGPVCGCGNHGCVEAYASGPAIAAAGVKAVMQGRTTIIGKLVNYDLNRITPKTITDAAMQGDAVAQEIYAQAGAYLGLAAANVIVTIGPRKVVIAGGVAAAKDLLLEPVRRTIHERVRIFPIDQIEVVSAKLGNNAGVIGVACWAAEKLSGNA